MLIINGVEDHLHLLVGVRPAQSLSDLMQNVKGGSSKWINDNQLVPGRFEWQEGYLELLEEFDVRYDEKYLFKELV